ncbi:hypothetical protein VTK26DRAFT_7230 [Humicola hyalothermophila]
MSWNSFLRALGAAVQSTEEETFELFAQDLPSHSLGFIDGRAPFLELTIAERDLTIHQSPAVLSSNRAGGTTGAVVWKITPLFAEWLGSPSNPLFTHGVLSQRSLVLELGCGISALAGLLLAPRIARYVLTDQPYVAKLVEQNIAENQHRSQALLAHEQKNHSAGRRSGSGTRAAAAKTTRPASKRGSPSPASPATRREAAAAAPGNVARLHFTPLDWETDRVTPALAGPGEAGSFDAVLACDCIYNEALIEPFVSTCVDVCRLRAADAFTSSSSSPSSSPNSPCVCVIAQQLRDPLVFEAWLNRFSESFHTWRVPDELLHEGLRSNSGFVVHVGVLKDVVELDTL